MISHREQHPPFEIYYDRSYRLWGFRDTRHGAPEYFQDKAEVQGALKRAQRAKQTGNGNIQ